MPAKRDVDESLMMKLYMDGRTDREMESITGYSKSYCCTWRGINDLPPNNGLFGWQSELKPSELKKIPVKYWNPRFKRVSA